MKVLYILVFILGLATVGNAQLECFWGIEVYVRDNAGNEIKNSKAELDNHILPYEFRNNHHTWTKGTAHGIPSINYTLKVSAKGYKDFEKQVNMLECGISVYELRLQPHSSKKEATLEKLTRLQIFSENVSDERVRKIVLSNNKGKRFESVKVYGREHIVDIKSGSYSLQLVKPDGSILFDLKELKLDKRVVRLKIKLSANEQTIGKNKELVCEYSKSDLEDWKVCELTIRDSKLTLNNKEEK